MSNLSTPRTHTSRCPVAPPGSGLQHRNLPLLLLQAREAVLTHFRPTLNAHGITEQQWRVVRTLLEKGTLEPRHIGEHCQISSASLAGVLARMDELGLVHRVRLGPRPAPRQRQHHPAWPPPGRRHGATN